MSIQWGQYDFDGPYLLDDWSPPRRAGIYAIMHKPNPSDKPLVYRVDYFGESSDLSNRGLPWNHHKSQCFIKQAGSKDNVYIAVYFMPGSSESERQKIEDELIEKYEPACNKEE